MLYRLILGICLFAALPSPAVALAPNQYPYQSCFETASALHKVPVDLLLAVAATESNWRAGARSHANAHGIMQIQWPGTAKHLGINRVADLYNPCLNISLGARYLAELLASFNNNESRALAAYNYGPTRIRRSTTLPNGAQRYVATVTKHRNKILAGALPAALSPNESKTLVSFESKYRATRVANLLKKDLEGALVSVSSSAKQHHVVLSVGSGGLSLRDRALIQRLGWQL